MHNVIVVGDANVDIIVPYPRFLDEQRTIVKYPDISIQGGGTSANTAVALSRLAVNTSFVGSIGKDQYGRFVLDDFAKEGVDATYLRTYAELNTVGVFAFVDEFGERYLWGWPRESQSFKVLDLDDCIMNAVRNSDWIHSSGMCLVYNTSARDSITRIFRAAYNCGIPTSFDLNLRVDNGVLNPDFYDALMGIMPYVTHLLGSGPDEFSYLGDDTWKNNAKDLSVNGRTVIARDGANGSIGFKNSSVISAPPFNVEVVDTIGAGDIYNAGYIKSMLDCSNVERSLLYGNAVAAYSVAHKGARNSPNIDQINEFLLHYDVKTFK
ncbi:carbohydrate kinase family protein [Gardnerella vaginalis]|uniref:carbohydrate kinase family protein n=1 Tax=Gardnerella vaginalis TaxID=2702 RepID=UPI0039F13ECC